MCSVFLSIKTFLDVAFFLMLGVFLFDGFGFFFFLKVVCSSSAVLH